MKKRKKQPALRNPVAREMIVTGCRAQVRQDKRRKNRAQQKAQDRQNLSHL